MVKLFAVCTPWIMILIGLGIYFRLARPASLNIIIAALPSSSWLKVMMPLWLPQGIWGRFLLTSTASSILFWPIKKLHIRRDMLAQQDIENFPKRIKLQFMIGSCFMYGGAVFLVATFTIYG